MFRRMINIVLRPFALLLSGIVLTVTGFMVDSMVFANFGFDFNGRLGYETGGRMGFILGARTSLIASSLLLFRKRAAK